MVRRPVHHSIWILLILPALFLAQCNAPLEGSDNGEPAPDLATQEQGMGSGEDDNGSDSESDGSSEGGYSLKPPGALERPPECIVPEMVIDKGWFRETLPQADTIVPGCPYEEVWKAELKVTHNWHQEQIYGFFDVDASDPAVVELSIYPAGDGTAQVLRSGTGPTEYPVTIEGQQTIGGKTCYQEGKGHYTITVKGTCRDGWLILSTFKMPFISDSGGTTKLWCDDDAPIEVPSFVPDASPALTPCFVISNKLKHGIKLSYNDGSGGVMETWLIMEVPDANSMDTILPLVD